MRQVLPKKPHHYYPFDRISQIARPSDNHETIDHECDLEAYCSSCEQLLPWALYQIRGLDGVNLSEADTVIAKLLGEMTENAQESTT